MGADGGTTPKRSEQVKETKPEEQQDAKDRARLRLAHCALSGALLTTTAGDIVCNRAGRLFNMELVLEHLLDAQKKRKLAHNFGIKKMKDLIRLKATMNKEFLEHDEGRVDFVAPFECPFTGSLSNGTIAFIALRTCGHVMSHKALRELSLAPAGDSASAVAGTTKLQSASSIGSLPSNSSNSPAVPQEPKALGHATTCPVCQASFGLTDVIVLAAESNEHPDSHSASSKKRSHEEVATAAPSANAGHAELLVSGEQPPSPKRIAPP